MLNYHTTPQISAVQPYGSHITSLGGYSLWGDSIPSGGHSGTQTPPMLYCVHSLRPHSPSASISRRRQEYGEMHMQVFGEPALEGSWPVSLRFFWPQFISVATKRLGSLPTVLLRKGEKLKLLATVNNSF